MAAIRYYYLPQKRAKKTPEDTSLNSPATRRWLIRQGIRDDQKYCVWGDHVVHKHDGRRRDICNACARARRGAPFRLHLWS